MALERIQKILAQAGVASRRAAEEVIVAGRVRVNGRVVQELGAKADPQRDRIEVDGKRLVAEAPVYFVLHKPRGVVSTVRDPEGRPTVREMLKGIRERVYPVGRLDFATSGVLLLTNDGAFADGLLHPRTGVPKSYVLKLAGVMSPADLELWRTGVDLEDGKTRPAEVVFLRHEDGKTWLEVTLREGRNQQIRRMGAATGFPVMRLARVSFAGIALEGLKPGEYRPLTRAELLDLKKEYGVPKRVGAGVASGLAAGLAPRRESRVDPHGRVSRSAPDGEPRESNARSDGAARDRGRRPTRDAGGEAPASGRRAGRVRPTATRDERAGGRYGFGAPGRRAPGTEEDYSGRSGRGSSRSRDEEGARADRPGRGGRTPTTGSSGGPRGASGDYRISRTRKR